MVNLINKQDPETGALICNRWCINGICENRVARFIDGIGYCDECARDVELDNIPTMVEEVKNEIALLVG